MTDPEIIDALATRCMGWTKINIPGWRRWYWARDDGAWMEWGTRWNPLANDNDAFQVVDAMEAKGFRWTIMSGTSETGDEKCAEFSQPGGAVSYAYEPDRRRAIALAALRAVGMEV
jgi:hypothetical protein